MGRTRESLTRKALWTLPHLMPGDPKAAAVLDVLDDIEVQERIGFNAHVITWTVQPTSYSLESSST
jgi:hypothetical protein